MQEIHPNSKTANGFTSGRFSGLPSLLPTPDKPGLASSIKASLAPQLPSPHLSNANWS